MPENNCNQFEQVSHSMYWTKVFNQGPLKKLHFTLAGSNFFKKNLHLFSKETQENLQRSLALAVAELCGSGCTHVYIIYYSIYLHSQCFCFWV